MIFTHCGKFGDMIMCLPILSAYYKKTGIKPTLALADFKYARQSEELLKMQDCIGEILQIQYQPGECWGGYPYHIDLKLNEPDTVVNLGFRGYPDKPLLEFVAEEHGLEIDYGFKLKTYIPMYKYNDKDIVIDRYEDWILLQNRIPGAYLDPKETLVTNLSFAAGAKSAATYATGAAMCLLMAGIPCKVYVLEKDYEYHKDLVYNRFTDFELIKL